MDSAIVSKATAMVLGFDPDTLPQIGYAGFTLGEPPRGTVDVLVPRSALDRYFGRG